MKTKEMIIVCVLLVCIGTLGIMISNKHESHRKEEEKRLAQLIDFRELREFIFYYHTHDGKVEIYKRIYVTTPSEEEALLQYLIKNQEWGTDCAPYYNMCDSISIATLDTLSIGHNYPCKMLQLQWTEKIIWRKN